MTPARTAWRRRLAALAIALVTAKVALAGLAVVDGTGAALASPWAPLAFLHQDVWALGAWALLELSAQKVTRGSPRLRRAGDAAVRGLHAAVIVYIAFNVPVARVLSTPLTYALLGTAGGELEDSIRGYLTPENLTACLAVIGAASALPPLLRSIPGRRALGGALLAAIALVALGPTAEARIESRGRHRNALLTLARTTAAHLVTPAEPAAPRGELAAEGAAVDLTHLEGSAAGRNVVLVVLESTGARYLRPYGAERDPTPRLSKLAAEGVVFSSVYAAYPESIKGLYSMLCATSPAAHTKAPAYAEPRLGCASVAEQMRGHGYATGLFHSGRFVYLGMKGVVADRGFDVLEDAATIGGPHARSFGTDDASTVGRVLEFVDRTPRDRPFFAVYMPIAGHHPYRTPGDGPRPFPEATEREAYDNDLFAGDAAFGALVDGLVARGLHERTAYVIVSDHGEAFHQHEGNFAHSLEVYEENVHVPFVITLPGIPSRSPRAPQIGSLVDVAPTLLALVGREAPGGWEGRSLLAPEAGLARFYTDHARFELGLRDGRWKFLHQVETGRSRLFDLDADPDERADLAPRHADRVARYRDHLLGWAAHHRARVAAGRQP